MRALVLSDEEIRRKNEKQKFYLEEKRRAIKPFIDMQVRIISNAIPLGLNVGRCMYIYDEKTQKLLDTIDKMIKLILTKKEED